MLFLPKGIQRFLEDMAMKREITLGSFLIEICVNYAKINGFVCNHPDFLVQTDLKKTKELQRSNQNVHRRIVVKRCTYCGEVWREEK